MAFEVEAALIDAYPDATNLVAGHDSASRGAMHSRQIIERYEALPAIFAHRVLLINVNRSIAEQRSVYEAVRYAWKLDPHKARRAELVLAVQQGLIIDAFVPEQWLEANTSNFPEATEDMPERWGFVGKPALDDVTALYRRRRVPDEYRRRGAANQVRYTY